MKTLALAFLAVSFIGATPYTTPVVNSINDASLQSLGIVTVLCPTSEATLIINGSGEYHDTLDANATGIIIQGHEIDYPNADTILLSNLKVVYVTWIPETNAIDIIDKSEQ